MNYLPFPDDDDYIATWSREESTEGDRERHKGYRKVILEMLLQGPKTMIELRTVTHRFNCSINELKGLGHDIEKQRVENGGYLYKHLRYVPNSVIKKAGKQAYYLTKHWRRKRRERLEFDSYRCCNCRSNKSLQVHHWVYELFGEDIEDLQTLCETCHKNLHAYQSVRISFPRRASPRIAKCLNKLGEIHRKRAKEVNNG